MTGLSPYTAWTRPLEDGTGYIARVEVRRVADGAVISAAEQVCTRSERKWAKAEEHALLGMAQTRASSRALKGPLQQIVELAGYKGTPAEEMTGVEVEPKPASSSSGPIPDDVKPTQEQVARIRELIAELAESTPTSTGSKRAGEIAGVPGSMLTGTIAKSVIGKLEDEVDAIRGEPESGGMSGGLQAAIRLADAARKGLLRKPTEHDRPPPSTLPGQQRKPLPGQTDLFGGEIPLPEEPDDELEGEAA